MTDPLELLRADGVIDEVIARLKGGKEADVWLVRHAGQVVAAKVYRARFARSFKNDVAYKDGRQVRNSRTQRAMDRGSRFGRAAAEDAWKTKEADALYRLHAAGLRVPRPVLFYEGVLLMDLVVDAHGRPAPRLVDAPLGPEQAAHLYAVLRSQVVGMLAQDLIHGDLSPFNVLLGADGPVVIDFPQVVGAAHNNQAESFLLRDLRNIHQFFAALDPGLRAAEGDGREIWRAYLRRDLSADFVPTGRSAESARPSGRHHPSRAPHARAAAQHPQGAGHPQGGGRPQRGGGGETRGRDRGERDRRHGGSMPEVIRIERFPRGTPDPGGRPSEGGPPRHGGVGGGGQGQAGGWPRGQHPEGARRRRWSRRRG